MLSIDDLYLTRAERQDLAQGVHPLLMTRGVPGTHDVDLGERILNELCQDGPTAVPRFNKAIDDRAPATTWPICDQAVDVVIFEGWCIGAQAQDDEVLEQPINQLETAEDPDARWRRYVNQQLNEVYPRLFGGIHRMVMLRAPSLEQVIAWRTEQEQKLAEKAAASGRCMPCHGRRGDCPVCRPLRTRHMPPVGNLACSGRCHHRPTRGPQHRPGQLR